MKIHEEEIRTLIVGINSIIDSARELEKRFDSKIKKIHPDFKRSAINLVHYMALRTHNTLGLQESLKCLGLTPFDHVEPHVMRSLLLTKILLQRLIGEYFSSREHKSVSIKKSRKLLNANTRSLFGGKPKSRRTRIMVTMPSEVAGDEKVASKFLKAGMNCARINCAHDNPETWKKMIQNISGTGKRLLKNCKIMMDLGGPKLRTGDMVHGPKVIHIKPDRDDLGNVIRPASLWLAPPDVPPPGVADAVIPVDPLWLKKVKRGDVVGFKDSREKNCSFQIVKKQGEGKWALCYDSTYLTTGISLILKKENKKAGEVVLVGELLPLEQYITVKSGDILILHHDERLGEPAKYDPSGKLLEPAHISCTMSQIFEDVKPGEPILFDDGKIEGRIETVDANEIGVKILNAKDLGSKLKAEKGINLPETNLSFSGLTEKDLEDLQFVALHADAVNISFVNDAIDVKQALSELKTINPNIGVILKIETRKGYKNLPLILLEAMQTYPVGVMIARGDLAVEIGWNDMATVQEEILRICEAAHVPDIWATQVLENMAKKGIPSRAEITDAGMSQRAECVMMNKGPQMVKAIKMLDRILKNMQVINMKRESVLPRLENAEDLLL